jgi:hypothetical protein
VMRELTKIMLDLHAGKNPFAQLPECKPDENTAGDFCQCG